MESLLLLVHRIPFPPNKGDKIRSYNLLKYLAQRYRVYLATFVDDADDWQHLPHVKAMCAEAHFAHLNPKFARLRSLGALFQNRSLSLDYYRNRGLRTWVDQVVKRESIDRIVVFSAAMAQYAEPYRQARRLIDFVDVDSDKWRQYAEKKSWPMSVLYRHEACQLLRYERHIADVCDASLFVSAPEADLFRRLAPESTSKIAYFNNGVDTAYFSPEHIFDNPYEATEAAVVFTGAMDYWPNVDAVQWFATAVFPRLRAAFPKTRFVIVGARPSREVLALAAVDGITVTGTVPDVRPFIHHAAVAVAPLRVARGIQNKVLEAMAMAKSVVVSPQALEGIDAQVGHDLVLASGADHFLNAVSALLREPNLALGTSARRQVQQRYSWASNLSRIDASLEGAAFDVMHFVAPFPNAMSR
ncbi:MAG: TIGR03087 family PEP-CTERM/XrtA system glycosyltransferase [Burkholderiaceae bacterium]